MQPLLWRQLKLLSQALVSGLVRFIADELAARGELPSYKVEGRRLFAEGEVARWLQTRRDGVRLDAPGDSSEEGGPVASIHPYRTANGERRYEVRFRDGHGRQYSRAFSVHKDALAFKLDMERRHQPGILYQAPPERFGEMSKAWLERFVIGAAGHVGPQPKTVRVAGTASAISRHSTISLSSGSDGR